MSDKERSVYLRRASYMTGETVVSTLQDDALVLRCALSLPAGFSLMIIDHGDAQVTMPWKQIPFRTEALSDEQNRSSTAHEVGYRVKWLFCLPQRRCRGLHLHCSAHTLWTPILGISSFIPLIQMGQPTVGQVLRGLDHPCQRRPPYRAALAPWGAGRDFVRLASWPEDTPCPSLLPSFSFNRYYSQ